MTPGANKGLRAALSIVATLAAATAIAADKTVPSAEPSLAYGAETYQARCVLCHGRQGHGDGLLALSIVKYPSSNLHENRHGKDLAAVKRSITYGGSRGEMADEMPPWGDELTYTQLESVALFTRLLLNEPDKAYALLQQTRKPPKADLRVGQILYRNYCSLCHGPNGEGDGKMAKVIKDPPPFNLTMSRAPDEYLQLIIPQGGEAMGRSPRMPPWGSQLADEDLKSVILYIKTLRR